MGAFLKKTYQTIDVTPTNHDVRTKQRENSFAFTVYI